MSHDKSVITELDSYLNGRDSADMELSPGTIEKDDDKITADEFLKEIKRLDPVYRDSSNTVNTL